MPEMTTEELKTLIRETVAEEMQKHPCRFSNEEARMMHAAADGFSVDQLRRLSNIAGAVDAEHESAVHMAIKIVCRTYDGVVRWVSIGILAAFAFIIAFLVKLLLTRGG